MKTKNLLLIAALALVTSITYAQVGVNTTTPKTTLQVEGDSASPSTVVARQMGW